MDKEYTRQKHKRVIKTPLAENILTKTLGNLKNVIMQLHYKQQHIINDWLNKWSNYIATETTFDPRKLKYYKRGEIILVDFGYNLGCEIGGVHYAVVIEKNNSKSNGLLVVVPICSLENAQTKNNLHHSEIYLGKAIGDVESYAKTLHIRSVSKQRIYRPKYPSQKIGTIGGELLNKIDEQIIRNFTN